MSFLLLSRNCSRYYYKIQDFNESADVVKLLI